MDEMAGEFRMKILLEVSPSVFSDCGHQIAQCCFWIHHLILQVSEYNREAPPWNFSIKILGRLEVTDRLHNVRMGTRNYSTAQLGMRSRRQRKSLGLTQAEAANAIGASRKFIVDLEAGKETASLGLTLKVFQELEFDEPGSTLIPDRGEQLASVFRQTLEEHDYEYALRLVGEYAAESLEQGRPLLRQEPKLDDFQYEVALAALTRWIAAKTQSVVPRWAQDIAPASEPVFSAEKIYPVGNRMKKLIKSETPSELRELNVWMREGGLARA